MRLKDKVAIITGAARGIGAAIAEGYGKEGAKVVIADILDGRDAGAAVEKAGSEALYFKVDVTNQEECDAMAKAAMDRFNGIDILVNNAAMYANVVKRPFMEITTNCLNSNDRRVQGFKESRVQVKQNIKTLKHNSSEKRPRHRKGRVGL